MLSFEGRTSLEKANICYATIITSGFRNNDATKWAPERELVNMNPWVRMIYLLEYFVGWDKIFLEYPHAT